MKKNKEKDDGIIKMLEEALKNASPEEYAEDKGWLDEFIVACELPHKSAERGWKKVTEAARKKAKDGVAAVDSRTVYKMLHEYAQLDDAAAVAEEDRKAEADAAKRKAEADKWKAKAAKNAAAKTPTAVVTTVAHAGSTPPPMDDDDDDPAPQAVAPKPKDEQMSLFDFM